MKAHGRADARHRALGRYLDRNLPDGRVVALNADTGASVGEDGRTPPHEFGQGAAFAAARSSVEGKVIVANAPSDGGHPRLVDGLDARTGNELWRWYAIPKAGRARQTETWKDKHMHGGPGGGGLWQTGSTTPRTRLTILGHRQTSARNPIRVPPRRQPLHQRVVALDLDTGPRCLAPQSFTHSLLSAPTTQPDKIDSWD